MSTQPYDEVSIRHRNWQADPNRVPVFSIVDDAIESDEHAAWRERQSGDFEQGPEPEPTFGTKVDYTMPASPNGGLALAYLKQLRVIGQAAAAGWLIEQAIGEAAYDAISAEPDVDLDTVLAVANRIQSVALGAFSDAAPKA